MYFVQFHNYERYIHTMQFSNYTYERGESTVHKAKSRKWRKNIRTGLNA